MLDKDVNEIFWIPSNLDLTEKELDEWYYSKYLNQKKGGKDGK